jgi:hypothetical protein
MRDKTIVQAKDEVQHLDKVSVSLQEALRQNYDELRDSRQALRGTRGDIELAAGLHNNKVSMTQALEEIGRRGYGRVAYLRQENDAGKVIGHAIYRVSQANANLPEAAIIARNSPLGSQIVSSRAGQELEIVLPSGERYFVVNSLIDIEGATQLHRANPDIKLARFYVAEEPDIDVIRGVRAFLEDLDVPITPEAPTKEPKAEAKPSTFELFWPSDWSKVILADEPEAALGAQFFTRTTPEQEDAIRAVRGVTVVEGIAGTGKTSVALGRLKFFANFRTGEHLAEYDLNPNDWADFDSADMVGFVLSPSLVQYLKQTAEDLEMRMKIMDFEEYRNQERESRRLFGRPYKHSAERSAGIQQTVAWLSVLAACACGLLGEAIERILDEPLIKPDSPEGKRIVDSRWVQIEAQFWKAGPMRARLIGLIRQLKGRSDGAQGISRLQGLANFIDRDVRLSDHETASLSQIERRALRDAVLNISLRLFRLLNPTELYVDEHKHDSLKEILAKQLPEYIETAVNAINQTNRRLAERLITDDDVVTALCLGALVCDQVERDIRDIPYIRTFSDRVAVFIDEYQDFTEQQVFLMGFRAKRKYRQITVAGDTSQRLHVGGIDRIANAFPFVTDPLRQISLDTNFRQSKPLAQLSNCFRVFTDPKTQLSKEPCNAPLHMFAETKEIADFLASKISALPGMASVVVIAPTSEMVRQWYELMAPTLESAFRSPIVSDRTRLTERLKTHFTTPLDAKGLEFDVAVLPDISQFNEADPIALNGLYVAASRPRHAILLGCDILQATHKVVQQLCGRGDLSPAPVPVPERPDAAS